jgi:hypothetical protein
MSLGYVSALFVGSSFATLVLGDMWIVLVPYTYTDALFYLTNDVCRVN